VADLQRFLLRVLASSLQEEHWPRQRRLPAEGLPPGRKQEPRSISALAILALMRRRGILRSSFAESRAPRFDRDTLFWMNVRCGGLSRPDRAVAGARQAVP
jgi:hypothetical protein